MGLDITAYRQATLVANVEVDEDGEPLGRNDLVQVYLNPDFPGRGDTLQDRGYYTTDDESFACSGWGYGHYNRWRDDLAKLAGYPLGTYTQYGKPQESHCVACWNGVPGPFSEMINFSDCEGVIGPVTSAKLAADFAQFDAAACGMGDRFYETYSEFRSAFELAADAGFVRFH